MNVIEQCIWDDLNVIECNYLKMAKFIHMIVGEKHEHDKKQIEKDR